MTAERIRVARLDEQERLNATIVLAFSADPSLRWAVSDPHRYLKNMPDFVRAFGGPAYTHSTAHCIDDGVGVALWLPPGVQPDEDAIMAVLHRAIAPDKLDQVLGIFEQMAQFHPTEPHWYLPLIGVDPARHRGGLGSALLRHQLDRCDRDGLPAYLEATSVENIPLYERHGFTAIGTIQTGDAPPLTPMLRKPHAPQL